jgi:integrase
VELRLGWPSASLVRVRLWGRLCGRKDFCWAVKGSVRRTSISMYHEYRKGPDGRRRRFFCVQWPKPGQGRYRQYFKEFREARRLRDQKLEERVKYGVAHLAFCDRQRMEYAEAVDLLRPFGKSLVEAARYFVAHLKASERSCTAAQLVEELIAAKIKDGMGKRHLQDLRSRLPRFSKDFDGQIVATITNTEVDKWLRSLPVGPTTRNNYRRALCTLFNFAVSQKYTASNPVSETTKAKEIDAPIGILSVAQTARLLEACSPELLPSAAIAAFCGLRPAELERLDWADIHFAENLIEVPALKSKTAKRRFTTIQPNLREWLLPFYKPTGKVAPCNYPKKLRATRKAAGIAVWPHDALRHSAASYHLAHFKNVNTLAMEMGNTPTVIFQHYRELVKPLEAERYWNIRPTEAG